MLLPRHAAAAAAADPPLLLVASWWITCAATSCRCWRRPVLKPSRVAACSPPCAELRLAKCVRSRLSGFSLHTPALRAHLDPDNYCYFSFLSFHFKTIYHTPQTRLIKNEMTSKDSIGWVSLVPENVKISEQRTLFLYLLIKGLHLVLVTIHPQFTLSAVIKACSEIGGAMGLGRSCHGVVLVRGFEVNCVIASALVDMYGRNCRVEEAQQVFHEMSEPDAICWTSVISAFTRNDCFEEALGLFYSMQWRYRLCPDGFTFGTILTACGNLGRVKQGKEVHGKVVVAGISGNVVVESSLLDMYGKCGLVEYSRMVFDRMPRKNAVSWCALLGAYCQNGELKTVLELFREMEMGNDLYSFGTVLRACAGLAAVRPGKEVHCQYLRKGSWRDVVVESALVDLYAKSGHIDYARTVFNETLLKNLITWNSMICGFAQNGRGLEAIRMFDEMVGDGIEPDYISFIGVLFACSHTGLVDQGRKYFSLMDQVYRIQPGIEHHNCMVDLLGRAGLLEEAENLIINSVFKDDSSLWAALIGACSAHSNVDVAERVAKKMMELVPDYHLSYVLLANIYRAVGQWEDSLRIRKLMKNRGIKKMPGKSWIEIKANTGSFLDLRRGAEKGLDVDGPFSYTGLVNKKEDYGEGITSMIESELGQILKE
ncbi:hypothetical protein Scep_028494 [Stephania cephalantha]|uniref:Pentatricopeptide repeat-containing protein n=1 Tax=Stephania cephalantha TaxID=152367 RepID=A0AAP0HLV8_9MAGN